MFITNIKQGADSFNKFRGRLLYAEVRDNNDELVCSATLDFILQSFFERQDEVVNYKEAFLKYLNFNDKMIKQIP
jgi:hypothetical protein